MRLEDLKQINKFTWEIPVSYKQGMRVPARIFSSAALLEEIRDDKSLEQLVNVSMIPGIFKQAVAMPDIHQGYGFPVGGVAATEYPDGMISPGGIGYDINCGVRLLRSKLLAENIQPYLALLAGQLQKDVPSGVGEGGRIKLGSRDINAVLEEGAKWAVLKLGCGVFEDLSQIESGGCLSGADSSKVSTRAKKRGSNQLGTLGAGNHFLEIQRVERILSADTAERFGLSENQVVVMIHCGSRGLGHQIATDYIQKMIEAMPRYQINLPDRELAGAPFSSPEGFDYFKAMSAAANYAWANRQVITHLVRGSFKKVLPESFDTDLEILYDIAHNIAKVEDHEGRKLIVHRKGATRAFPKQPVLIPGSMGTASYVLAGLQGAMEMSFGSSCHGAGRRMSRNMAKRQVVGRELLRQMEKRGIAVAAGSMSGLAEEAPQAYKNVDEVISVVDSVGIAKAVARLTPLAVVKG